MTHNDAFVMLDAFVDGDLPVPDRDAVARHVAACRECSDERERIVALKAQAAALPRGLTPPVDPWPAIAEGIARRPVPWVRWIGAAAVLAAVVASALLFEATRQGQPDMVPMAAGEGPVPVRYEVYEARYQEAVVELEEALAFGRERLAPETVAIVERSLAIVDAAIAEARAALAADPASAGRWDLLSQRYRDKLMVLQSVSRLVTRS